MAQRLYIQNFAAPPGLATPGTKGTWSVVTNATTYRSLVSRAFALTAGSAIGATKNVSSQSASVLLIKMIGYETIPQAGRLAGNMTIMIGGFESATALDACIRVHVWVSVGDTDVVRGTLINSVTGATASEFPGTAAAQAAVRTHVFTVTPVTVYPGDRIVMELGYAKDPTLAGTTSTSAFAQIYFSGTSATDLAVGASNTQVVGTEPTRRPPWIEFADTYTVFATPPTTTTPTSVLDIGPVPKTNHFDIQLAIPGAASVEQHSQSEIGSGYTNYPWYYGNAAGTAVVMRAPADGPVLGTTARCEHREVNPDGTDAAFDATVGVHILHGRSKITKSPTALPDIVLAQLHNGTTDRISFRTQFQTSTLRLRLRVNGSSAAGELVPSPYGAGMIENIEWEWKIEVINNLINFYLNDMVTPVYTSAPNILVSTGNTWYFKAGCYLQTTTDGAGEYGEVELRDLWHSHAATSGPEPGRRMMMAA